jgi:uncharacterized repeat protein (TIGR04138 family)
MAMFHAGLAEVVERDPRFTYEAYEFLFHALHHTQKVLGREPPESVEGAPRNADSKYHVSGPELLQGVRDLALREFGLMARTVFRQWGIQRTGDFGDMVFNLVEAGLMSKTDEDNRADFHEVYDLDQALVKEYRIQLDEAAE